MIDTVLVPKLVTLVYAIREQNVLLLRRNKWPYVGHWVAPGGKVEPGESPREGAVRELEEETGLVAGATELRAIVAERSRRADWQWLIYIYRCNEPSGTLLTETREGQLKWFSRSELATSDALAIPPADRIFMQHVLNEKPGVVEYQFDYDAQLRIQSTTQTGKH